MAKSFDEDGSSMQRAFAKQLSAGRAGGTLPSVARTFASQDGALALCRRAFAPSHWPFAAAASMM
jgi:hypothetical protein